ncbi:MAG: DNA methyltransferase, partial [Planctomycetota bacterium]
MKPAQRELRNHLRARARQLGDCQDRSGRLAIDHLVGECAYEHWHRMLFARFLAENGLLIEPQEKIAISLAEAEDLAKEGGVDVWVFASRCAQRMLPQIFRPDDPLLQVSFATEHRIKLEKLLASLPQSVFTASDALGWVYQFWQSKKKDEVNRSEVKIGADQLPAVTQLFTEPYMVEFLLHNTLGAWWAGKRLTAAETASAKTEDELRRKVALPGVGWEYLRFVRGADDKGEPWRPAAGTFDGWPKTAAELKVLDPCCGSGHFLVAALRHLVPIRMAEEGLSAAEAVDAVLRDNLHGLEIDERCCQIAAFALAFAAWTYPDAGGYRPLPDLHIACTGIGPQSTAEEWVKLAEQSGIPMPAVGREAIKNGLLNLHRLFSQAPTLGSLINPADLPADLITAEYKTIQPYLAAILKAEKADDETRERAIAAAGMVKAADLLAAKYMLVITNVPYLARGAQSSTLAAYCEQHYGASKVDLATVFLERCGQLLHAGGSCGLVLPRIWTTYTKYYEDLRRYHLSTFDWQVLAALGPRAFATIRGEIVDVVLFVFSAKSPNVGTVFARIDCASIPAIEKKIEVLMQGDIAQLGQLRQLKNPGATIVEGTDSKSDLLEDIALVLEGLSRGDIERYDRKFWELPNMLPGWTTLVAASTSTALYHGRSDVFYWEDGRGVLAKSDGARIQGQEAWGKNAVFVARTHLNATLTLGAPHAQNGVAIVPRKSEDLPAILAFCRSREYRAAVMRLNQKLIKPTGVMGKVPFDKRYWREVEAQEFPNGIPKPFSIDPIENVFDGNLAGSTSPLIVAVARLLGFTWPEAGPEDLTPLTDDGGIVCIPSVRGEEPAAERLLALLAACCIQPAKVRELAGMADLDDWLRDSFFEEHCKLFHDRPFVWHIWDGRKRDGFHALVNYHKLAEGGGKGRKLLENLTYSYLGEWIGRQQDGVKRGEEGSEDRLAAAMELQKRLIAIIKGEQP